MKTFPIGMSYAACKQMMDAEKLKVESPEVIAKRKVWWERHIRADRRRNKPIWDHFDKSFRGVLK